MQSQQTISQAETQYSKKCNATFYGLLYWPELDEFWIKFKQPINNGWFIYALNEAPPVAPVSQSIAHMDGKILSTQQPIDLNPKQPERSSWWKNLPFLTKQF